MATTAFLLLAACVPATSGPTVIVPGVGSEPASATPGPTTPMMEMPPQQIDPRLLVPARPMPQSSSFLPPPPTPAPAIEGPSLTRSPGRTVSDCEMLGDAAAQRGCLGSVSPGLDNRTFDSISGRPIPFSGPGISAPFLGR